MYTARTQGKLPLTPTSMPPSSVEVKKKHGAYCRIKTAVKKVLRLSLNREKEVKEDPCSLVCCLLIYRELGADMYQIIKHRQEILLRDEEKPFNYLVIRHARVILGLQIQVDAGRIPDSVGEVVMKHLWGGEGLGEEEFAAYMHRAVLQGETSAARASIILGVTGDSEFWDVVVWLCVEEGGCTSDS
jgi:hypothetical protein